MITATQALTIAKAVVRERYVPESIAEDVAADITLAFVRTPPDSTGHAFNMGRSRCIDSVRKHTDWHRARHIAERPIPSSDNTELWQTLQRGDPTAALDIVDAVSRVSARLSDRDRRIVADYVDGSTMATVAATHGVVETRVSQIVNEWRANVREELAR